MRPEAAPGTKLLTEAREPREFDNPYLVFRTIFPRGSTGWRGKIIEGDNKKVLEKEYRRLAKLYHPDTHPSDEISAANFRAVSAAYTTLTTAKRKLAYDARIADMYGQAPKPPPQFPYPASSHPKSDTK